MLIEEYFKNPQDLDNLLQDQKQQKNSKYDCLLLYAGGRGSAYALYQLVDMGYNVLAITYDNGYFTESDLKNIKMITESLGVDHHFLTHKNTAEMLKLSMRSAKTVCNGCFFFSSSLAVEYAKNHGINVVVGATLSRGQIIENKLYKFIKQGLSSVEEIENELLNLQKLTPSMNQEIFDLLNLPAVNDGSVYTQVKVVDFYRYFDITNEEMISYLNQRDSYWKKRKDYAIYSTNCPLKQIGDYYHLKERKYHYYGSATSWEKRLGHLTLQNLKEDLQCKVTEKGFKNFAGMIKFEPVSTDMEVKYLCAYVVADDSFNLEELKEFLLSILPNYMVPSAFVELEEMPLTSNGKIDRKALPEPDKIQQISKEYVEPRNQLESGIATVWASVLGIERVGIDDNFIQLGGDSIKAIQLASQMNNAGYDVKIKDIFTYQTIRELTPHIAEAKIDSIDQGAASGKMSLTAIQRWFS